MRIKKGLHTLPCTPQSTCSWYTLDSGTRMQPRKRRSRSGSRTGSLISASLEQGHVWVGDLDAVSELVGAWARAGAGKDGPHTMHTCTNEARMRVHTHAPKLKCASAHVRSPACLRDDTARERACRPAAPAPAPERDGL